MDAWDVWGVRRRLRPGGLRAAIASAVTAWGSLACLAQDERVYTVGNYPVEAHAQHAVAAKDKAIAEGQQAAFRSLLKRLVPVTSYKALGQLKAASAANMVSGISVRSERNSSTSYTASLDFRFDSRQVRELLRQRGIPYLDEPAKPTAIVLLVQPAGQVAGGLTPAQWRDAWSGLDLDNSLAPITLHERPATLTPEIIKAAASSPEAPLRSIAVLAKSGQALLALAEPDMAQRKLSVTLSGTDGVGPFVLRRTWRIDPSDPVYAAELAAVVAARTLEGRWKAVHARGAGSQVGSGAAQAVQIYVEFRSPQEWTRIRRQLEDMPGVSDFTVGGASNGAADVALRYPGGGGALAEVLASLGIELRSGSGGTWLARAVN